VGLNVLKDKKVQFVHYKQGVLVKVKRTEKHNFVFLAVTLTNPVCNSLEQTRWKEQRSHGLLTL